MKLVNSKRILQALAVIFFAPLLILFLSDAMSGINKTTKQPLRGYSNNRIATALFPSSTRNLAIIVGRLNSDRIAYKALTKELITNGVSVLNFEFSGHSRSWGFYDSSKSEIFCTDIEIVEKAILSTGNFASENIFYIAEEESFENLKIALDSRAINPKKIFLFSTNENFSLDNAISKNLTTSENATASESISISNSKNEIATNSNAEIFKIVKGKNFLFPHYNLTTAYNIEKILNAFFDELNIGQEAKVSWLVTFRSVAIFLALIGLVAISLLLIIFSASKKRNEPPSLTRGDIYRAVAILPLWILSIVMTFLVFEISHRLRFPILPSVLLVASLISFFGIFRFLLSSFLPRKFGFREQLDFLQESKMALYNRERELNAFQEGLIITFGFLLILLISFRGGVFYILPLNSRQFWMLAILIFTLPAFYFNAIEAAAFASNLKKYFLRALINWLPIFLNLALFALKSSHFVAIYIYLLFVVLLAGVIMRQRKVKPAQIAICESFLFALFCCGGEAILLR